MYCTRRCLRTALRAAADIHRHVFFRHHLQQQAPTLCSVRLLKTSSTAFSEALATPPLDGAPKEYSPKIQQLVSDIASLTLIEVSDLNELLKKTLNIQDVGMMPMGAMAASAVPAAQATEEEEVPVKKEKTQFTVKLTELKAADKVKLIKEVKNCIQGLNLVQAKKLVESLPQEIRANVSKDEAEKLKAALEAAGGTVVLE
ncbi:39S ribosomal protein L12, mitochondrial isoform X1 [Poeciliopsis prolifica]|uniref:39S ribosomal protein L12, mitochondrial isoform X1 n=1 Tax=Poeciliopsis prolifica TaxID=188132 RepID=UPI00241303A0|nr:39S ribosomal protein L12, mitochondrial isoform X1 [Poeciliopsis prolifica]